MKHNLQHHFSKFISWIFVAILLVGSCALLAMVIKLFLKIIGVL